MTLSIAIQSCTARASRATALAKLLSDQVYAAKAYGYAVFDPVITMDVEQRGARYGASLAWKQASFSATHHLVIQDDAIPCADFIATVSLLVALHPDAPISCCSFSKRRDAPMPSFRATRRVAGAQAIVMPTRLALTVAEYLSRGEQTLDDEAIAHVLDAVRSRLFVTSPALVQHDVSTPSLVGHDETLSTLVASDFVGRLGEARFLPWHSAPIVHEVF